MNRKQVDEAALSPPFKMNQRCRIGFLLENDDEEQFQICMGLYLAMGQIYFFWDCNLSLFIYLFIFMFGPIKQYNCSAHYTTYKVSPLNEIKIGPIKQPQSLTKQEKTVIKLIRRFKYHQDLYIGLFSFGCCNYLTILQ